jgi:hypothetical protein
MKLILPEQQTKTREVKAVLTDSGVLYYQKDEEWWFLNPSAMEIGKSFPQSAEEILSVTSRTPLYACDHITLEI